VIKKAYFFIIIFLSPFIFAETYSCEDDLGAFTLKRVVYSDTFSQFQYQRNDYNPDLYSITRENENYLYLMRDYAGGASFYIIGKTDNSFVGAYLKHEDSSSVFDGKCFLIK
tara:strand:+ start:65 stop:400 length:336 start_codon:yes stop_codon:yes gene_type:complete